MYAYSMFELTLFAAASLGVIVATRIVLRMIRSRAAVATKSGRFR